MKVLIVSDTHGRHTGLDRVLEKEGQIDLFIHLGDIEGGESYINSVVECEKHMVRGNNDFFSDLPREEEIDIASLSAFLPRICQTARIQHSDSILLFKIRLMCMTKHHDIDFSSCAFLSYIL